MRVLFVNWVDYLDPEKRGGGVSVYQRNLIAALDMDPEFDAGFISCGTAFDLRARAPYVRPEPNGGAERYSLVNSGVTAPSHADFASAHQISHPETTHAFAEFVEASGPWDIVHFNNLEGLPAEVLALRERWPNTRFVLSLHNYYPFCPQVNLWVNEREHCADFHNGTRCETCLLVTPSPNSVRSVYKVNATLNRLRIGPGTAFFAHVVRPCLGMAWRSVRSLARLRRSLRRPPEEAQPPHPADSPDTRGPNHFAQRRARMVELINTQCDAVLGVSKRVSQIAESYGIAAQKLHTLYIGTEHARLWHKTSPRPQILQNDGTLRLAYLGYMRRDKGFYFLMEALAALPDALARKIHLTVAAKSGEQDAMALLAATAKRLGGMSHVNGYSHDDLDQLLASNDAGVIPVMWEDNLPQVAIEMHARHLPLITSDRGGAQELGQCPEMTFNAGSHASFQRVLERILNGEVTQDRYWENAMPPVDMPTHIDELRQLYASLS